jgi:AraC-like DNA-binding protein
MSSMRREGAASALAEAGEVLLQMLGVVVRAPQDDDRSPIDRRMVRIDRVIDENLALPRLGSPFVASRLGVSPRTLQSWFAALGTTPRAYIQARRLERAALALRNGEDASITAIAIDHGFSDSAHFARCFQRRFGRYPRAYRRGHEG